MKSVNGFALLFTVFLIFCGCSGKVQYIRPGVPPPTENSIVLSKSKDVVWKSAVSALGKNFFVINNLDKDSGLINISYSGDPQKYINCGRINSYVSNARGERTYDFDAASAYQKYEVIDQRLGYGAIERKMNLEGRMNLIIESLGPDESRITANTKYVVTKSFTVYNGTGRLVSSGTDTISFNSGQSQKFSDVDTTCIANGQLEQEVLASISENL